MDYSDRMLRSAIEKLPDGTYEAEGHIDGFVEHPDPAYRDLKIKVALTESIKAPMPISATFTTIKKAKGERPASRSQVPMRAAASISARKSLSPNEPVPQRGALRSCGPTLMTAAFISGGGSVSRAHCVKPR